MIFVFNLWWLLLCVSVFTYMGECLCMCVWCTWEYMCHCMYLTCTIVHIRLCPYMVRPWTSWHLDMYITLDFQNLLVKYYVATCSYLYNSYNYKLKMPVLWQKYLIEHLGYHAMHCYIDRACQWYHFTTTKSCMLYAVSV